MEVLLFVCVWMIQCTVQSHEHGASANSALAVRAAACNALIFVNLAVIRHLLRTLAPQRLVTSHNRDQVHLLPGTRGVIKIPFSWKSFQNYNSLKMKYLIRFEQPEPKHLEFGVYMLMRGF